MGRPSSEGRAAGLGDRGLLIDIVALRMGVMFAPKAAGSWHLQCALLEAPLEARVLFSSVGAALGNVGQANYAAGNACLDTAALSRRASGVAACSRERHQAWCPKADGAAADEGEDASGGVLGGV